MTDQTPSTEDVRYGYRTGVTAPILPVEAGDAFDAWLDDHDQAHAVQVLREAAASGHRAFTEWVSRDSDRDYLRGLDAVLTCDLRAMADRIGAGDE